MGWTEGDRPVPRVQFPMTDSPAHPDLNKVFQKRRKELRVLCDPEYTASDLSDYELERPPGSPTKITPLHVLLGPDLEAGIEKLLTPIPPFEGLPPRPEPEEALLFLLKQSSTSFPTHRKAPGLAKLPGSCAAAACPGGSLLHSHRTGSAKEPTPATSASSPLLNSKISLAAQHELGTRFTLSKQPTSQELHADFPSTSPKPSSSLSNDKELNNNTSLAAQHQLGTRSTLSKQPISQELHADFPSTSPKPSSSLSNDKELNPSQPPSSKPAPGFTTIRPPARLLTHWRHQRFCIQRELCTLGMQGHLAAYYAHLVIMRHAAAIGIQPPPQEASTSFYGIFRAPEETNPLATTAAATSEWLWGRGPPKPYTIDQKLLYDQDLEEAIKFSSIDDEWEPPEGIIPAMGRWRRARRRQQLQRTLENNFSKGFKKKTAAPAPVAAFGFVPWVWYTFLPWVWYKFWEAVGKLQQRVRKDGLWGLAVAAARCVGGFLLDVVLAFIWLVCGVWETGWVGSFAVAATAGGFFLRRVGRAWGRCCNWCSRQLQRLKSLWTRCIGGGDGPPTLMDMIDAELEEDDPLRLWLHQKIEEDVFAMEECFDADQLAWMLKSAKDSAKAKGGKSASSRWPGRVKWKEAVARALQDAGKGPAPLQKDGTKGKADKPPQLKEPKPTGRAAGTKDWREPPYKWPKGKSWWEAVMGAPAALGRSQKVMISGCVFKWIQQEVLQPIMQRITIAICRTQGMRAI